MSLSKYYKKGMVSVIIPNYNYAEYIDKTIESVLNQTYDNYEIIVVDDNSDDNSRIVVNKYIAEHPKKIKLIHNETGPSGTPNAINLGISRMEGEFFCWLSSDDIFLEDKISKQVELLKKKPKIGMVFTNYNIISEDDAVIEIDNKDNFSKYKKFDLFLQMFEQNVINGNTVMIRRNVFSALGLFESKWEKYPHSWIGTEYLKWMEIILHYDVAYMSENLHLSRKHAGNSVYGPAGVWRQVSALMLEKFFITYSIEEFWQKLDVFDDKEKCVHLETCISLILKKYDKVHILIKRLKAIEAIETFVYEKVMKNLEAVDYFDFIASIAKAKVLDDRNTAHKEFLSYNYDLDCLPYFEKEGVYSVGSALNLCCDFVRALELFNYLEKNVKLNLNLLSGVYFHLGEIYFKKSNMLKAKGYLDKCIELTPAHKKASGYINRIKEEL